MIAVYRGDGRRRRFINAGAWLAPGEAIVVVHLADALIDGTGE